MKVLVTGGGGFLGRHICKELKKRGHEVFSFSRNHYSHLEDINVTTIKGNLQNKEDILKALDNIDTVFHTAAIAGVWGKKENFYKTNLTGTKNIVDSCLEKKIKYFVNTSSPSVVFSKDDILNGNESLEYPKSYLTHYPKTKAMAEEYVFSKCSLDFQAVSLRPHLIFGKDDPHIIPRLVQSAKKRRLKIVGDGTNLVDVIHVENAAIGHVDAFEALVRNPRLSKNAYFIGQEKPVNLWDFINQILINKGEDPITTSISFSKAFKIGKVLEFIYKTLGIYKPEPPMTRFVATNLAKSHYFSHEKAKRDFNYTVHVSLEEALKSL